MSNIILKNKGIKTTVQREVVFDKVSKSKKLMTIKEIYGKCIGEVDINLSTLYRIIDLYIAKNIFDRITDSSGNLYYEVKTSGHRHFIECMKCNKRTTIDCCSIDSISNNVLEKTGYVVLEHNLQLKGTCKECSKVEVM